MPRGGTVVLTNSTEVSQSGTHSLKTTGRTAGFNGPSLNILPVLTQGATYQITASVRLVTGTPATQIKMTVQRTPTGGSSQFDTVAQSSATGVTDSAWTTLTGLYSYTTDSSGLLFYIESSSATASYYVDDFNITFVSGPPGPLRIPRDSPPRLNRVRRKAGIRESEAKYSPLQMPTRTAAPTAC